MTNQPKRKPRPKVKKINTSTRHQWQTILKDIDTDNIPINLLQAISVNLIDGTNIRINIVELIADGNDPDFLDKVIRKKINDLESIIKSVDFFVSINAVAETVQPITDEMLKDL